MPKKDANTNIAKKRESSDRELQKIGIADSITVLVHGTFSHQIGFWYRPHSRMARYLRRNVFNDVYGGADYFRWVADADDEAREEGKDRLLTWCERHPARKYDEIFSDTEELEVVVAKRGHFKPVFHKVWRNNDLDWVVRNQ